MSYEFPIKILRYTMIEEKHAYTFHIMTGAAHTRCSLIYALRFFCVLHFHNASTDLIDRDNLFSEQHIDKFLRDCTQVI